MVRIEKNPEKDMKLSECKVHNQQCQTMITNVLAHILTYTYLDGNERDGPGRDIISFCTFWSEKPFKIYTQRL